MTQKKKLSLKKKILILKKFQYIFIKKIGFIMLRFLNPHVNFICIIEIVSLFQKLNRNSFFFKIHPYFPIWFSLKSNYTMDN